MGKTQTETVLQLMRRQGILRPRDLAEFGIAREQLLRLMKRGMVVRRSRGVYMLADAEPREDSGLAEVCKRFPLGVICLLSALQFHKLANQAPKEIWLAINRKARLPRIEYPSVRIVRFASQDLIDGVAEHRLGGVAVHITTPVRSVVDCFVYRNKIGLDVALDALRNCWRTKKSTLRELSIVAKKRRMASVMRPYLESLK